MVARYHAARIRCWRCCVPSQRESASVARPSRRSGRVRELPGWESRHGRLAGQRQARRSIRSRSRRCPGNRHVRCLVTGAAGFIGSHLSVQLLQEGHEVAGLDDLSEGSLDNLGDVPEMNLIEADVRSEEAVRKAVKGCEVIFHQGALRSVFRSMTSPGPSTDVNVRGTLNVLMSAHEAGARVVFASSSSVYGDQKDFPLRESQRPEPRSPYAATKLTGEVYCQTWWRSFGVPTISLRYFNVYGARQDATSEYAVVVPKFILACLTGEQPIIYGDGEQSRDFTFIDDVVEANLLAARAEERAWGSVLNVGGGQEPTSINRLLAMIAELTGSRPDPIHADPRPGDVYRTYADISLSTALIGYQPRVKIAAGLERTAEWFRTNHPAVAGKEDDRAQSQMAERWARAVG